MKPDSTTTTTDKQPSTDDLRDQVIRCHSQIEQHLRGAILDAKEAGDALCELKRRVGHGNWTNWLKENFQFTEETARGYMRISKHWAKLQTEINSDKPLTIDRALTILGLLSGKSQARKSTTAAKHRQQLQKDFAEQIAKWSDADVEFIVRKCRGALPKRLKRLHHAVEPVAKVLAQADAKLHAELKTVDPEDPLPKADNSKVIYTSHNANVKNELLLLLTDPNLSTIQKKLAKRELKQLIRREKTRVPKLKRKTRTPANNQMTIHYSGDGAQNSVPEKQLGAEANVMQSFDKAKSRGKPNARMAGIMERSHNLKVFNAVQTNDNPV